MMRAWLPLLIVAAASGQDAEKPADPITDKLRFEIAISQRNYLDAQLRLEHAQTELLSKTSEAQKACATQDKIWDAGSFTCQKMEKKP